MRKLLLILFFIFIIGNLSAECNESQIDINSASAEELDNLAGIGPAYATRIIESRPFDSVDDLLGVDGIGEKTLEKIKLQRLVCVRSEEKENNEKEGDIEIEEEKIPEEAVKTADKKIELSLISLDSKDIKSGEDKTNLLKNLAFGGIVTFCFAFGALFFVKNRKRKNEFR